MFVAKDKEGNRVTIEEAARGGEYFCPLCGDRVIVKAKESEAVSEHFAHKNKVECDSWRSVANVMSEWHRAWQNCFPKECREVVVQSGGVKHIADVLINNDTVIEFQHSPITAEEIAERNRFYTECGYKVVWVFDADGKIKNKNKSVDTIDPILCAETDLCWKRPKREFSIKMPENVTIYLQYRTSISNSQYSGQESDILLLVKSVDTKQIVFYETSFIDYDTKRKKGYYIIKDNFLKEYGGLLPENFSCLSITEIIERRYLQQQVEKQRAYAQQSENRQTKPLLRMPRGIVTRSGVSVKPKRPRF